MERKSNFLRLSFRLFCMNNRIQHTRNGEDKQYRFKNKRAPLWYGILKSIAETCGY